MSEEDRPLVSETGRRHSRRPRELSSSELCGCLKAADTPSRGRQKGKDQQMALQADLVDDPP